MLNLAILGLLKERPMHGYELKKRLSYMLGHFWTVSYGSLYPALKRMERSGYIERAYSVKEKTRHRNVYRITPSGEEEFMDKLTDTMAGDLYDNDSFDLRMAFFQYLDPETRIRLLEKRREYLEEQVARCKAYRSGDAEEDRYRTGLLRHKVELARSDIRWLDKLISHERENIAGHETVAVEEAAGKVPGAKQKVGIEKEEQQVTAASGA